jgi:hypothetical protein
MFLEHEEAFGRLFSDVMFQAAEASLEQAKSLPGREDYWSGKIDQCDLCHRDMNSAKFMIDGAVGKGGPWACMCSLCFKQADGEIGWGRGQLYESTDKGWLLVSGGPPDDEA